MEIDFYRLGKPAVSAFFESFDRSIRVASKRFLTLSLSA